MRDGDWRGLGLQSRLIAGVSPIAAIAARAAAPPVGFPRLVQYSPAMAPIPVYGGQGQCQAAGPHILLCTAHIIQPLLLHHFRICQTLQCWTRLSDETHVRTIVNRRLRSFFSGAEDQLYDNFLERAKTVSSATAKTSYHRGEGTSLLSYFWHLIFHIFNGAVATWERK